MADKTTMFIDPMVDWSFKRLFGTEVNKDILIGFLKAVFPRFDINDIAYIPTEQMGIMEEDRKAVFDVLCRMSDGKEFLVEMQRSNQTYFFERALYYTSFPILKQGKRALKDSDGKMKPWDFRLDGVFFLGVLNFERTKDSMTEHRYMLKEEATGELMTDRLEFVFIEIPKFRKTESELETDMDKWLYLLKNLSQLSERPAALRDRIFSRIFEVAEFAGLKDEEKQKYIEDMNTKRDTYNQIEFARNEGREEGREEGKIEIAKRMISAGISIDMVAKLSGLDIKSVENLTV